MFKITDVDNEFQKLVDSQKQVLNKTFKNSFLEQEAILEIFVDSINHCNFNNFDDDKVIWNASGYVNLISLDLKHFAKDLALADNEWAKRVYARMISMLIYETLNDLLDLLGKDFRLILKKLSEANELSIELNGLTAKLNKFKSMHFSRLKEIRNVATAHRDKDFLEQYNSITTIGWTEFIGISATFDQIINELGKFLQRLINLSVAELKK